MTAAIDIADTARFETRLALWIATYGGIDHLVNAAGILEADRLLDAMDFVGLLCDGIEADKPVSADMTAEAQGIMQKLEQVSKKAKRVVVTGQAVNSKFGSTSH